EAAGGEEDRVERVPVVLDLDLERDRASGGPVDVDRLLVAGRVVPVVADERTPPAEHEVRLWQDGGVDRPVPDECQVAAATRARVGADDDDLVLRLQGDPARASLFVGETDPESGEHWPV